MLQIAVCEDEQADRDNLTGILKPLLDKYTEECDYTTTSDAYIYRELNRYRPLCCIIIWALRACRAYGKGKSSYYFLGKYEQYG